MYFYASKVLISLYFDATKSEATPNSWKLTLLISFGWNTKIKSISCTQICIV